VKRYQAAYIAHVATIHQSTVSELRRCEERAEREEKEAQDRRSREETQAIRTIEQHTAKLL